MFNVHRILMLVRYFHTVYCSYNATKEGFGWEAFYVVGMSVWLSRRFLEIGEFESKCKVAILSVLFFNCRKYKYFSNFGSWERCKCVNNEYFISFKSEYYQQIKAIIFDSIYYIQYILWCKCAAGDSFKSQRWITESFMSAPRQPSCRQVCRLSAQFQSEAMKTFYMMKRADQDWWCHKKTSSDLH